ncbi:hypothetical protein DUF881 [Gottschalkia acidurici 9a]|uniref:Division initiation protein n=1 Tax=Gottschalkia acidurici (strain ATCC 7906 / DSM 604 / BCRC 14475 / CIP 104303 / KCTC 5404 / NCIMB 10678 / 9a) TaxID=1128398 RepID=K0B020_GOTA9|nr:DUF881 domain-containing protein [Gottschalkia acidurici]AFS78315.1 hypothetical protein DUF881 [Gottschalkia acidurici 9a]
MNNNIKNKIAMTTVCIILGIILTIQFKTVDGLNTNILSTQRSQQIAVEYKKLKNEKEKILKEMELLEKKVSQYEKGEAGKDDFLENLYKDIEKYKMLSGYEDVSGPGVTLQIDEPPAEIQVGDQRNTIVEHYGALLEIISLLNAVEAEAISINDQRYTAFTEIVPAGNLLEINGMSFGTPIVIKVIGDPEDIENALRIKGGIIWLMEEGYNLQIHIKQEKDIFIPKYKKVKEFKNAKPAIVNANNP